MTAALTIADRIIVLEACIKLMRELRDEASDAGVQHFLDQTTELLRVVLWLQARELELVDARGRA